MRKISTITSISLLCAFLLLWVVVPSFAGPASETVASVNGERINGLEFREYLGIVGGGISASGLGVPMEKKKEILERLIDGRLIEQAARSRKLDNTAEFLRRIEEAEEGLLISALLRMEISGIKIDQQEVKKESARLRKEQKNLSKENALAKAKADIWQKEAQKIEQDIIAAARKETEIRIDDETIEKIGKGEKVEDNTAVGAAAGSAIDYGDVKTILGKIGGGMHGGRDLGADPQAIRSVVDRELTGKALLAYARKRNVEDSEWMKTGRQAMQRSILIELFTDNVILKGVKVSEKEIGEAYAKHSQMLVRNGKKIPLSEVKENIRGIIMKEKSGKAIKEYLEKRKKKAKIRINEKMLSKA